MRESSDAVSHQPSVTPKDDYKTFLQKVNTKMNRSKRRMYDKIVANAPNVIASQPKAGAAIWDPKCVLSRLGTLSTPGLLRDCFVGVRLLAMTSFLS